MKHLLFLCSRNRLRSPTAHEIFADHPGIEVDSAGLAPDAEVRLSVEQIEWADLILVMERAHRTTLNRRFGRYLREKKVVVLGIPDRYEYMDPKLIERLQATCSPHLR
ncbi:MAG: phosphotyrosine protein phosphatase [Verrucomicrobiales bacterium]|nr:phosphotyrosine protein phosphatase [Verrucomicrobiales bacterium]